MTNKTNINTQRFGIIDIGTNSVRLLIADFFYDQNTFDVIKTDKAVTRLGEGLYDDFIIKEKAISNTLLAIKSFSDAINENNCDTVYCFATSAVRDAKNKNEFISHIKSETNIEINVISGETEALFSAMGASIGIKSSKLNIIDIGGGSTEIIFMEPYNLNKISLDIGCVRLKEMFSTSRDALEYITNIIHSADISLQKGATTVFTGGTADNLSDIITDNAQIEIINGDACVRISAIKKLYDKVCSLSVSQRINLLPRLDPARADIIDYGLLIIIALSDKFKFDSIILKKSSNLEGALMHITSLKSNS